MDFVILIPLIVYFLLILLIGIYTTRFSSRGISEFFLGGRQMHKFVVALSAVVSGRSAWLLLGFTGQSYTMGLSAVWAVVGYIVVECLLFLFYAPRIRKFSGEHNCITLPDYFAARFNDKHGYLRILLVLIIMIFMVTYIAAQFVAGGKAFFAYFGMDRETGIILTGVIILLYTFMGGFMAVSLTDVVQAFVMLFALVLLPVVGIIKGGGPAIVLHDLKEIQPMYFNPVAFGFGSMIGFLGIGLGSPGNPHIIIRYMSMKDPSQFRWTAIVGTTWNVLMALGALFIGFVARYYFPEAGSLPGGDPENAYITLANKILPTALVGVLLASVFAAIMSSADSQLLVAASGVVRDIYEKIIKKGRTVSQQKLTFLSRFTVALLVYIAIMLALMVEDIVFWFVLFAWAGLGAAIGPTSLHALFNKRTTMAGVMAGMIAGTATVFLWKSSPFLSRWLYELIPGFIAGAVTTYWISEIENLIHQKGVFDGQDARYYFLRMKNRMKRWMGWKETEER